MRLPRIPDLLTTANLACGVASILFASQGQLTIACGLVFAAAFFDVLDGLAARALGGGTPLGAQLDSLADMVSFGVAPAFLLFVQASGLTGNLFDPSAIAAFSELPYPIQAPNWPIKTAAIILALASCWRLAKFNLDTRQTSGFLGLPTPANGLLWISLVLVSLNVAIHPGSALRAFSPVGRCVTGVEAANCGNQEPDRPTPPCAKSDRSRVTPM